MKKGGTGGNRTTTGLKFEKQSDFLSLIQAMPGYSIKNPTEKAGIDVFFNKKLVCRCFKKYRLAIKNIPSTAARQCVMSHRSKNAVHH